MSTPVIENIALALVDLINGITTANGYNQDLSAARPKRINLADDVNTDKNTFISQGEGRVEVDANEVAHWVEEFFIQVMVIDSDDATTAIDSRMNQIAADIQKQLKKNNNWKLNGYSAGIDISRTERGIEIIDGSPQSYIEISIDVHTEYMTADPFTLG